MGSKRKRRVEVAPEQWYPAFLSVLQQTGNVALACAKIQVGRSTVYRHRRGNAEFRQGWEEALEDSADALEAEARRRAVVGVERRKLILYKGEPVIDWSITGRWVDAQGRDWVQGFSTGPKTWIKAEWVDDQGKPWVEGVSRGRKRWTGAYLYDVITEYSDTLLAMLLKGAKPEKYGDRLRVDQEKFRIEVEKVAQEFGVPVEVLLAEARQIRDEVGA